MANFDVCFSWLMRDEDPANLHATTKDNCPDGCTGSCYAISGINSGAWPLQFAKINALPQDQRGVEVENFYQTLFWNQWFDQIASDEIAKRVFDMAVNGGAGTAVKLLQQAVNWSRDSAPLSLVVDGQWGPKTVEEVNKCNQDELVSEFQQARCAYYECIVAKNPADAQYLNGWLARAKR